MMKKNDEARRLDICVAIYPFVVISRDESFRGFFDRAKAEAYTRATCGEIV